LGGDNPLKVAVLSRLSLALYFATSRRRRDSLSREAVAMARRLGDPDLLSRALFDRHFALWGPDNLADRAAAARAYQRRAADGGRPERVLEAYRLLIPALLEQGDIAAANDAITAHARLAEDLRLPEHRWRAAVWASTLALMNGAFAEAEERIGRALAIGQQAEQSNATLFFGTQLYALRAEQGRLAEIEAPARVAAQANTWLPSQRAALAHLCCDLGHREEARREFDRLASGKPGEHGPSGRQRDDFAHLARDASWLLCMSLVAEVCAMLADGGRAATLYRILLPYAAHCVVPGGGIVWSGSVERRLGLLAATLGRWNETAGHFEREIALCTRVRARPALAHAQYDYAAMLIMAAQHEDDGRHADERSRDVHQARGLLAEALATARELGMNRLVAAAEALAASLSTSRPSTRPSFPDGLTAREVEVLRLLAVGRTNSEIAAQLVLSVRTVERHIETIYEKIGAHGRAARAVAASYAHGHGLMVD
jgi:DNA-binding CsgD family transcriptional regulator